MRFRACFGRFAGWEVAGAAVMLAAAANPALANEAAPLAGHEPMAVPASSGGQDRVFVAQPVGQVSVGLESGDTGRRMFAARSQAGSASMVSFSATRPRPVILGTPGTMGTMGTMGAPLSRASLTSSFGARRPAANGGIAPLCLCGKTATVPDTEGVRLVPADAVHRQGVFAQEVRSGRHARLNARDERL